MQLEKWKEEKEKKRKEAAINKPKPFIAGVAYSSKNFIPPPPVKTAKPTISGVVTRSQAARNKNVLKLQENSSFAPKNFKFTAPVLKNPNIPALAPVKTRKENITVTFKPIMLNSKVQKETLKSNNESAKNKVNVKNMTNSTLVRITRSSTCSIQSSSSGDFIESIQNESRNTYQSSSSSSDSEKKSEAVAKAGKSSRLSKTKVYYFLLYS